MGLFLQPVAEYLNCAAGVVYLLSSWEKKAHMQQRHENLSDGWRTLDK